ncbi:LPS export ABC transporter ATP-binding protein [Thermodesulforhabdus norvegica]|uniref:Lipopolysaccharide export system ATP-binding protein n=1 Tax=Thermodesulforhabdus norvegica TaxID=39841 RepID=A0A1I4VJ44_9BACT|nr:LPS export ABC transporter ATP-binding protein [Thermodesulforhabdus norvegica]SFN01202.1 lipopolysaccharide export system ATP-binding protein [Thermodesulforhabdus norvegica]
MSMLTVRNIVKTYGQRRVVDDVSFSVTEGTVVGLLGPNGAGKSTTFYCIVGLIRPDEGAVLLNGEDILGLPMHIRAQKGITYLPQESSVFRKLTAAENITAVLEMKGFERKKAFQRARSILEEFGISHVAYTRADRLSGGERRRVEICRALVTEPRFILLDEPFAGIDPIAVQDLQKVIRSLKDRNIGVVITDHNVRETLSVCDRAYIIHNGRIIEEGSPEEIVSSERAKQVYLGEEFRLN